PSLLNFSLTVRPDATLTINCKVSYSVTDYSTAWIRQPAGKALEWIGVIWHSGSLYYKDSLKSKFSISRDTSNNSKSMVYLKLSGLTETTVSYYRKLCKIDSCPVGKKSLMRAINDMNISLT
uniref:Immunoglobulin V-set domain-containing protein n=1 Tax=Sinocyclocheilus rhinocerous TaxID=307959 RepID=A0A673JT92_9TELE